MKESLDKALSQAIQDWLLSQSDPDAKRLAQDLNSMMGKGRVPIMTRVVTEAVGGNTSVAAIQLQNWIELLSDFSEIALSDIQKEEDFRVAPQARRSSPSVV